MYNFTTRTVIGAVALSLALASVPARAQEFINVLTGGTSGVYYPLGVALSEIYGEKIEGARTQVQATKASVENLNLLAAGQGRDRFRAGRLASTSPGKATPRPASPARSTSCAASPPSIRTIIQIVASQESGIKTLADLEGQEPVGRRAGVGHRTERPRHLRAPPA